MNEHDLALLDRLAINLADAEISNSHDHAIGNTINAAAEGELNFRDI